MQLLYQSLLHTRPLIGPRCYFIKLSYRLTGSLSCIFCNYFFCIYKISQDVKLFPTFRSFSFLNLSPFSIPHMNLEASFYKKTTMRTSILTTQSTLNLHPTTPLLHRSLIMIRLVVNILYTYVCWNKGCFAKSSLKF